MEWKYSRKVRGSADESKRPEGERTRPERKKMKKDNMTEGPAVLRPRRWENLRTQWKTLNWKDLRTGTRGLEARDRSLEIYDNRLYKSRGPVYQRTETEVLKIWGQEQQRTNDEWIAGKKIHRTGLLNFNVPCQRKRIADSHLNPNCWLNS